LNKKFKCEECKNGKIEELFSLSEYGDVYYDVETSGKEYCESCFKELEEQFTIPVSKENNH